MGQVHKNCANSHSDTYKDNEMIPMRMKEAVILLMSTPIAQYTVQKVEELLETFEKLFNRSIPQTNNNFREHVCDLKTTDDNMRFKINGHATIGWFLLIPVVVCFHLCHFYINVTLFMVNKPPVDFQDLRWSLQNTRLRLTDIRKKGSKKHRYHQKLVAARLNQQQQQQQSSPEVNVVRGILSKWPIKYFIEKLREILNFLGIITIPLHRDLKFLVTNSNNGREEKHGTKDVSKNSVPVQPVLTRRVSVTVQEIIFEETEDSLETVKDSTKKCAKPNASDRTT